MSELPYDLNTARTGEASGAPSHGGRSGRRIDFSPAACLVGISWILFAAMLASYVSKYHYKLPFYDEWWIMPQCVGASPITWKWLWAQHNEHRCLIGKLIACGVARLSHGSLRALPFIDAVILLAASGMILYWLRRQRGSFHYSDALIPMLFMGLGQFENLLWAFQVSFVLWCLPTCYLVLLACSSVEKLTRRQVILAGFCLAVQPLFGAQGLPVAIALTLWYIAQALSTYRFAQDRRDRIWGVSMILVSLLVLAETAFYFVDYKPCSYHPHPKSWEGFLQGIAELLHAGWGMEGDRTQIKKHEWYTITLYALCSALAMLSLVRREARMRSFGILMSLGGIIGLGAGISWGRSGFGVGTCNIPRYVTLALPGLLACYCSLEITRKYKINGTLQFLMLVFAVFFLKSSYQAGLNHAKNLRGKMSVARHDIRAHMSIKQFAHQHAFLFPFEDRFREYLKMLAQHKAYSADRLSQ